MSLVHGTGDMRDESSFSFNRIAADFDDMADRAIPLYDEMHRMQSFIVMDHWYANHYSHGRDPDSDPYCILDIGCSTGRSFNELDGVGVDLSACRCIGIDNSTAMLEIAESRHPEVDFKHWDARHLCDRDLPKADIILCNHTLQFLPNADKRTMLLQLQHCLKREGLLFLSHKESDYINAYDDEAQADRLVNDSIREEYNNYKLANEYTQEEIDAKTKSLDGVMQCISDDALIHFMRTASIEPVHHRILLKYGHFTSMVFYHGT